MVKKITLLLLAGLGGFLLMSSLLGPQNIEKEYKSAVISISKKFFDKSDPQNNSILTEALKLRLISFARPQNPWADDAQYIYMLSMGTDMKSYVKELERTIAQFPNFKIDPWTRENFGMFPKNDESKLPLNFAAHVDLLLAYSQAHRKSDYERLKNTMLDRYPNHRDNIEKITKSLESNGNPTP